jgi:hypothetical protein
MQENKNKGDIFFGFTRLPGAQQTLKTNVGAKKGSGA